MENRYTNNDFFRMGAAVAVGELFDEGCIAAPKGKSPQQVAQEFLASFGVSGVEDLEYLGIQGSCLGVLSQVFE